MELEISAHWSAATSYAAASLMAGGAAIFNRWRGERIAIVLLGIGVITHVIAIGIRWISSGHGPYLGRYEAFSSHALMIVVVYLLVLAARPALRTGVVVIGPIAFLLLGLALLSPSAPTYPSPAMGSPWLTIHVTIAKLAFATSLAAGTAGLVLGLRDRPSAADVLSERQSGSSLETLSFQLLGYVFFLMSIVLLSGSIWAKAAWGSYWRWDPVETWALIFWLGCAFVLHFRRTAALSSRQWAWLVVGLVALSTVTFVGYGHFGVSLHSAYVAP